MNDLDERLERCFVAVFPALARGQVSAASAETTPGWDSLHALMLVAVLEETFDLEIPTAAYSELRSYTAARRYLEPLVDGKGGAQPVGNRQGVADPDRHE